MSADRERINAVKALWLLWCLAVAACTNLETKPWFRADGNPGSSEQLDLDKTTCRQEMQQSVRATTQAAALDRDIVRSDVYGACMARLGYSDKSNQRFTPPAPPPPVQGASPPPAVAVGAPPPPVPGSPPASSDQKCRQATDFRMWLPLCP